MKLQVWLAGQVRLRLGLAILTAACVVSFAAAAHDTHDRTRDKAAQTTAPAPENSPEALPFRIGGSFALIDQDGKARGASDPDGQYQLLFFGYASCEAICDVALPRMAETVDLLAAKGKTLRPVLITVDPENDTSAALRQALPKLHPRMVGLTGSPQALAQARQSFQVQAKEVARDFADKPIFAHGSFVYLLDPSGKVLTLLPPILGSERMAEAIAGYL